MDDLLQAVFLKALEGEMRLLKAYQGRASLGGYLATVASRAALEGSAEPPDLPIPRDVLPSEDLERKETEAILREELSALPPEARLVLLLQAESRTVREIALALGFSEAAAAQRLVRARALLRPRLEARGLSAEKP